jgi:hypothetical protein
MVDSTKPLPSWMKVASGALYADVSRGTFRNWLRDGLPHVKVKGIILVRREWLDEWLEGFLVSDNQSTEVNRLVEEVMRGIRK